MRVREAVAAALSLFVASSAMALTADELIAKNIQARGGLEKIRAIQTLRSTGTFRFSGPGFSVELRYTQLIKRPGMMRMEVMLQGLSAVTAWDGSVGWQVQPFQGRVDPERMAADDVKGLQLTADIDGPLVDAKAKGNAVEYLGTEDVDGTDAHKLKVTLKNGGVRYVYLDPDYFLEIRTLDQITIRGVLAEQESDLGNYEQVNGWFLPFSIESGAKGGPKGQKITLDKVEANVELGDAMFHFPAAAAGAVK
jgi:outer membrane lipoprotein-sorting protein